MIEKPLFDKYLSTREKNEKFFKRSLMVSLVKTATLNRSRREPSSSGGATASTKRSNPTTPITPAAPHLNDDRKLERQNPLDYNLLANLDTFGLSTSKPDPVSPKARSKSPSNETPLIIKRARDSPKSSLSSPAVQDIQDVPVVKKSKVSPRSSDNESYSEDEEDENDKLMIVDSIDVSSKLRKEKVIEIDEPKSPENLNVEKTPIQAKMIPLEKNPSDQPKTSKEANKDEKDDDDDDDEKLSLFELIAKMHEIKNKSAPTSKTETTIVGGSIVPVGLMNQVAAAILPQTTTSKLSGHQVENAREFEYVENMHDNVSYCLWTIGGQSAKQQKVTENSGIKLIVRQSIDGYVNTETSSLNVFN